MEKRRIKRVGGERGCGGKQNVDLPNGTNVDLPNGTGMKRRNDDDDTMPRRFSDCL